MSSSTKSSAPSLEADEAGSQPEKGASRTASRRDVGPAGTDGEADLRREAGNMTTNKPRGSGSASATLRRKMIEERAKKMGQKYGLIIESSDLYTLTPNETVLRMERPVRMRVRRTCHKCKTTFSAKSICSKCLHVRCDKCPRYPPKESSEAERSVKSDKAGDAITDADLDDTTIQADLHWAGQDVELRRPSKTGSRDLVHRRPRQRVRRTCHECGTVFASGSRKCGCCHHIRCTDCPRDPPKSEKYPFGYPGDVFGPDSEVRFECESCETLYPPKIRDGTPCEKCGLEKSDESPRTVPRKIQPAPNVQMFRQLQARLDGLGAAVAQVPSS